MITTNILNLTMPETLTGAKQLKDIMHRAYIDTSASTQYLIGYVAGDAVYCDFLNIAALDVGVNQQRTKRNGDLAFSLYARYGSQKWQYHKTICDVATFDKYLQKYRNAGQAYEALVAEKLCGVWYTNNSTPYYKKPDLIVDKIPTQVKFASNGSKYKFTLSEYQTIQNAVNYKIRYANNTKILINIPDDDFDTLINLHYDGFIKKNKKIQTKFRDFCIQLGIDAECTKDYLDD